MAHPFKSLKPKNLIRNVVAGLIVAGLSALLTVGVLLKPMRRRRKEQPEQDEP